jgi:hypothetical protein
MWLGSIGFGGICAGILYFLGFESGGFVDVVSIILFIVGASVGAVYLHKWLEPLATIWYLSVFCKTKVSFKEAGELGFLFDGSLNGKWYPFKDLVNIPEEYRKKVLYEIAEKLMGYKFKTNPYYTYSNNTYSRNYTENSNTQYYENKTNFGNGYSNSKRQNEYTTQEQQSQQKSNEQKYTNDYILACKIMGINNGFTKDELKSKYRELMKQYHPDLFANSGQEIKNIAETKTRQINAAYEYLSNI